MDEKEAEARPVMGTIFLVYMFRTDAQLCPVTQPVIPLHNRSSRCITVHPVTQPAPTNKS